MNYDEAIEYIESLAVFGSIPGFERINALLERLDNPEKGLRYVHVAGTNGKGSVCTAVSNILIESGFKTGLFTSPFVSDFRERIQLNGEYIPKETLARLTEKVKAVSDKLAEEGIQPTEFEVITAATFLFFKEEKCDFVVLEVGLGGLLDSTNVIDPPLVSAITSLSVDHTGILGNTIEEIAMHKAGIIKDGSITVSAPNQPEGALHVLRTSAYEHSNKFVIADPSAIDVISESIFGTNIAYKGLKILLPLIGPHQILNLSISLAIIEELRTLGYEIPDDSLKAGIEKTTVPARIEVVSQNPITIIDGGHNADGSEVLAKTLSEFTDGIPKTVLIGVMADKEVDKILANLATLADKIITTTPNSPRAMAAPELARNAEKYCKDVRYCENPLQAYDLAEELTDEDGCIVVCGSLYLAGDLREYILRKLGK